MEIYMQEEKKVGFGGMIGGLFLLTCLLMWFFDLDPHNLGYWINSKIEYAMCSEKPCVEYNEYMAEWETYKSKKLKSRRTKRIEQERRNAHAMALKKASHVDFVRNKSKGGLIDMRWLTVRHKNISYKSKNMNYYIRSNIAEKYEFKEALEYVNTLTEFTITATTNGEHRDGEYSHKNGYKMDIRTKNRTFSEIVKIMKTFKMLNIYTVFEYEDNEESIEIAEKLRSDLKYNIRKAIEGEHIDINFAKDRSGKIKK